MILATHTSRVSSFLPTIATASRTANRAAHRSIYQKTVFNSVEGAQTAKLHDEAKEPQEEPVPSEPMPPRLMRKGTDLEATSGTLNQIAASLDLYSSHLTSRKFPTTSLQRIQTLNTSRKSLQGSRDENLGAAKKLSGEIGKIMKSGGDASAVEEIKAKVEAAKGTAEKFSSELGEVEAELSELISALPNLLDDSVPTGPDESQNEVISSWGSPSSLPAKLNWSPTFTPKWHDDVALSLSGWLSPSAVKMSGSRFASLSSSCASLERALSNFFLDELSKSGYTEVSVPSIVGSPALTNTGQLPKFEEDLFKIHDFECNGDAAYLIPTAEVPITNLHSSETFKSEDLPKRYAGLTDCYRKEAGSYGRDSRGLIRLHQFKKVEMVTICHPDSGEDEHQKMVNTAEGLLQKLEIPYRKVLLCSGDTGFSAQKCYDLEAYLPSTDSYREISSISSTGDFQSQRAGIKFKEGKKKGFCYTLNGSGLAVGRALVAVLENYQMEDGRVKVPEVLKGYMGGKEYLE
ncbi:hypothetical protein TrST_g4233 [Triparma strigata]|uniref:Serine--tRNA ligase n=1 Tax=Triparma strigata TaxID=1606541 RepID=A0A9W6ZD56_9STRA|nr:hypothetical protein TrST_g4233 [Triparma strigata]